jgi:hypothetical protein
VITNPKIERKKTDIARTEVQLTEVRSKLSRQKHELRALEDEEIVAMFRNELYNEDEFFALMRSRRETTSVDEDDENSGMTRERKEETNNALYEN